MIFSLSTNLTSSIYFPLFHLKVLWRLKWFQPNSWLGAKCFNNFPPYFDGKCVHVCSAACQITNSGFCVSEEGRNIKKYAIRSMLNEMVNLADGTCRILMSSLPGLLCICAVQAENNDLAQDLSRESNCSWRQIDALITLQLPHLSWDLYARSNQEGCYLSSGHTFLPFWG